MSGSPSRIAGVPKQINTTTYQYTFPMVASGTTQSGSIIVSLVSGSNLNTIQQNTYLASMQWSATINGEPFAVWSGNSQLLSLQLLPGETLQITVQSQTFATQKNYLRVQWVVLAMPTGTGAATFSAPQLSPTNTDTTGSESVRATNMLTANANTAGTVFTGNNTIPFIEDAGNVSKSVINSLGNVLQNIIVWAVSISTGIAGDATTGQNTQIAIEEQTTVGSVYQRYLAQVTGTVAANADTNDTTSFTFPGLFVPMGHSLIVSWSGMVGAASIIPLATIYYTLA